MTRGPQNTGQKRSTEIRKLVDHLRSILLSNAFIKSVSFIIGDCEMAVCGGVSSIITPEQFIPLCRARMMSAVGQCQTFCDTADGYARGEGCGIVILKRLDQVYLSY